MVKGFTDVTNTGESPSWPFPSSVSEPKCNDVHKMLSATHHHPDKAWQTDTVSLSPSSSFLDWQTFFSYAVWDSATDKLMV